MGLRSRKKDLSQTKNNNTETDAVVVHVGSASKLGSLKGLLPNTWKQRGLLAVCIVIGVVLVGLILMKGNKPAEKSYALTISGSGQTYNVTQDEYAKLIEQGKKAQPGVPEHALKNSIIEAYQYKIAAKELKIEPTESEVRIAATASSGYSGDGALNEWQQLQGYASGVEGNLKLAQTGGYVGVFLDYPYNRANPDAAKVEADRVYAAAQAAEDRDRLANGTATAESIMKEINADSRLVSDGYGSTSKLFKIDTDGVSYRAGDSVRVSKPAHVMSAIDSLGRKTGVSTVQEVRGIPAGGKREVIFNYFLVTITEVLDTKPDIENDFKKVISSIKVTDDVK